MTAPRVVDQTAFLIEKAFLEASAFAVMAPLDDGDTRVGARYRLSRRVEESDPGRVDTAGIFVDDAREAPLRMRDPLALNILVPSRNQLAAARVPKSLMRDR